MKRIAIVGGGPSAVFLLRQISSELKPCAVTIFECDSLIGNGFPYSCRGARIEHITNVSSNELPELPMTLIDWWRGQTQDTCAQYDLENTDPSEEEVVPRLFFGAYLQDQFKSLNERAKQNGFTLEVKTNSPVKSIAVKDDQVELETAYGQFAFDAAIICTGHRFPKKMENKIEGYFDSPYPPDKLARQINHPVCIRGSSLTAIDAIATMAKHNGKFLREAGALKYVLDEGSEDFRLHMYSKNGLLPAARVFMEEPYAGMSGLVSQKEIQAQIAQNDGFLPIDFIYRKSFLDPLRESDPEMFNSIKDLSIEQFVDRIMQERINSDAFELLRAEYEESINSLTNHKPIPWKELIAGLSVAMSYPAKHFCAEDRLRLQNVLMPLIGVIIALVPPSSAEQLLALHDAGVLELFSVTEESEVQPEGDNKIIFKVGPQDHRQYQMFVDCIGQPHLDVTQFPIKGLTQEGLGRQALVRFKSAEQGKVEHKKQPDKVIKVTENDFYLTVPGFDISDHFQLVDQSGAFSENIYMMAVPFISGLNPDYSGLDFCDIASRLIVRHMRDGVESKAEKVSNRSQHT